MKKFRLANISFCMVVISLLNLPLIGKAQPYVDLLNLKYRSFPKQAVKERKESKLSGSFSEAFFLLPLEQKNKSFILIGGDYSVLSFHSSDPANKINSLYSTSMQIGFDRPMKNTAWRQTFVIIPKFNGDYKGLSKSFQPGGALLFNYKRKTNLKYHFGLYYNREFFGDFFVPLLGIDWKINSRMNLFGDLPSYLSFEYRASNTLTFGTGYTSTTASYRIHGETTSYISEGDKANSHYEVKLYLNFYATKHLVVYCEAGQTINRKYTNVDSGNNKISSTTIDGSFITGGLAYRFAVE